MSQLSLPENGIFNFSSANYIADTMQLIETRKNLPMSTLSFFEKNIRESELELNDEENSLEISLNRDEKSEAEHTEAGLTPKKKRVGCICKKTKCLKMYCECFASGKLCIPECACYNCHNSEAHHSQIERAKESIKQKNHLSSETLKEYKGCTCKKSRCQKKYCECFNQGVACGELCKCEDCANKNEPCSHRALQESELEIPIRVEA